MQSIIFFLSLCNKQRLRLSDLDPCLFFKDQDLWVFKDQDFGRQNKTFRMFVETTNKVVHCLAVKKFRA